MTFATWRWRGGSADTALRDRLDALYVAGCQAELGQVVELRRGAFAAPARPRNGVSAADAGIDDALTCWVVGWR